MSWSRRYAMDKEDFGKSMGYYCNVGNHYMTKEPICDTEGCPWIGYPKSELLLPNPNGELEGIGNNDHSPLCKFSCDDHRMIKCERCGDTVDPIYFRGHKLKRCKDCMVDPPRGRFTVGRE